MHFFLAKFRVSTWLVPQSNKNIFDPLIIFLPDVSPVSEDAGHRHRRNVREKNNQ